MFITLLFILGGLAALTNHKFIAGMCGATLLANIHPAGTGWWYLTMIVGLWYIHWRITTDRYDVR